MTSHSLRYIIAIGIVLGAISGCDEEAMEKKSLGLSTNGFNKISTQVTHNKADIHGGGHFAYSAKQIEPVSCHNAIVPALFMQKASNKQVKVCGVVTQLLGDQRDSQDFNFQRFVIRLDGEDPQFHVTIKHNIDLAERIDTLKSQDNVMVYGVYQYDPSGGYIHTTHHDLTNTYHCGWIEHGHRRYQ